MSPRVPDPSHVPGSCSCEAPQRLCGRLHPGGRGDTGTQNQGQDSIIGGSGGEHTVDESQGRLAGVLMRRLLSSSCRWDARGSTEKSFGPPSLPDTAPTLKPGEDSSEPLPEGECRHRGL